MTLNSLTFLLSRDAIPMFLFLGFSWGLHGILAILQLTHWNLCVPTWASLKTRSGNRELPYKKPNSLTREMTWKDLETTKKGTGTYINSSFQLLSWMYQVREQRPHKLLFEIYPLTSEDDQLKNCQATLCLNSQPSKLWVIIKRLLLKPLRF